MTQEELQMRLAKSVQRAVRKYLKDGGKIPDTRTGEMFGVVTDDCDHWTLYHNGGSIQAPGEIWLEVLE